MTDSRQVNVTVRPTSSPSSPRPTVEAPVLPKPPKVTAGRHTPARTVVKPAQVVSHAGGVTGFYNPADIKGAGTRVEAPRLVAPKVVAKGVGFYDPRDIRPSDRIILPPPVPTTTAQEDTKTTKPTFEEALTLLEEQAESAKLIGTFSPTLPDSEEGWVDRGLRLVKEHPYEAGAVALCTAALTAPLLPATFATGIGSALKVASVGSSALSGYKALGDLKEGRYISAAVNGALAFGPSTVASYVSDGVSSAGKWLLSPDTYDALSAATKTALDYVPGSDRLLSFDYLFKTMRTAAHFTTAQKAQVFVSLLNDNKNVSYNEARDMFASISSSRALAFGAVVEAARAFSPEIQDMINGIMDVMSVHDAALDTISDKVLPPAPIMVKPPVAPPHLRGGGRRLLSVDAPPVIPPKPTLSPAQISVACDESATTTTTVLKAPLLDVAADSDRLRTAVIQVGEDLSGDVTTLGGAITVRNSAVDEIPGLKGSFATKAGDTSTALQSALNTDKTLATTRNNGAANTLEATVRALTDVGTSKITELQQDCSDISRSGRGGIYTAFREVCDLLTDGGSVDTGSGTLTVPSGSQAQMAYTSISSEVSTFKTEANSLATTAFDSIIGRVDPELSSGSSIQVTVDRSVDTLHASNGDHYPTSGSAATKLDTMRSAAPTTFPPLGSGNTLRVDATTVAVTVTGGVDDKCDLAQQHINDADVIRDDIDGLDDEISKQHDARINALFETIQTAVGLTLDQLVSRFFLITPSRKVRKEVSSILDTSNKLSAATLFEGIRKGFIRKPNLIAKLTEIKPAGSPALPALGDNLAEGPFTAWLNHRTHGAGSPTIRDLILQVWSSPEFDPNSNTGSIRVQRPAGHVGPVFNTPRDLGIFVRYATKATPEPGYGRLLRSCLTGTRRGTSTCWNRTSTGAMRCLRAMACRDRGRLPARQDRAVEMAAPRRGDLTEVGRHNPVFNPGGGVVVPGAPPA